VSNFFTVTSVSVPSEGLGGFSPSAITLQPFDFLLIKKGALPSLSPHAKLNVEILSKF